MLPLAVTQHRSQKTPEPEVVPLLLEHWWEAVTGLDAEAYEKSEEDRAWHAWFLHFWFLWIHPFEDGNGRTSRLFLNMLRLRWGLPWLIAEDHEKWRYYQEISFLGETWFRKRYPAGIYPTDQFGRILDPKFPKRPRNLLAEYMDVPTGHVPMRYSIRSRK